MRYVLALVVVGLLVWLLLGPTYGVGVRRWQHASTSAVGRLTMVRADGAVPDTVRIVQEGQFRLGDAEDSWKPFTATQVFTTNRPGFVWDARISMGLGMVTLVRDSYIDGVGSTSAAVQGLWSVVDASGSSQVAEGALQRWFAETVWFPHVLQTSPAITWEPLDRTHSRGTLTDHGHTVSLEFTRSADGDVTRIFAPARMREVSGSFVPTAWEVVCTDYVVHNGTRMPRTCEVAWFLPAGRFPYWRGTVVTFE